MEDARVRPEITGNRGIRSPRDAIRISINKLKQPVQKKLSRGHIDGIQFLNVINMTTATTTIIKCSHRESIQ